MATKKRTTKKKTAKKKTGRPTKFKAEYVGEAYRLSAELFATDVQLAKFFEVDIATIYRWKVDHPAFCEAIKDGKIAADAKIEHSLFHRAAGYTHDDVHISNYQGDITVTPIKKHHPPETTACIFWLTNRNRAKWKRNLETHDDGQEAPELEIKYSVRKAKKPVKVTNGA